MSSTRVLHIITSLDVGGAEMMLTKLLGGLGGRAESCVVVLMRGGVLMQTLREKGIAVQSLGLSQGAIPSWRKLANLYRCAREFSPTVLQGWMYHGNLAASILHMVLKRDGRRLLWNVRQTLYTREREKPLTRLIIGATQCLAGYTDVIIYNSVVSALQHEAIGYPFKRRVVIPNGFDENYFFYNEEFRRRVRRELAIPEGAFLIGQVARFHPMKGHEILLQAAKRVISECPQAIFILVGNGLTSDNPAVCRLVERQGLWGRIILAGERADIPALLSALDLLVSASEWGEGFPNVIGEAMACELPCVVTDVGDSATIVGEFGRVVPRESPDVMAAAILELSCLGEKRRRKIGASARARVKEWYSLGPICEQYLAIYKERVID